MRRRKARRRCFQIRLLLSLMTLVIFFLTGFVLHLTASTHEEVNVTLQSTIEAEPIIISEQPFDETVSAVIEIEDETILSDEEVELIALVTMAEAEGECEEGKRLVIDTILNRVDSEYFPNTVYEVIYQPSQFSSMWNGRIDRCEVREDICQLVREEAKVRANYEVMFFTAGNYGKYGVPMFQVENHYFSSYE